jgi:hypothetical protein
MMRRYNRLFSLLVLTLLLLALPGSALAQDYYFQLPKLTVDVYWNEDGTEALDYYYYFKNDTSGHSIEYVDLGLPNSHFDISSMKADVDGNPVSDFSASGFQGQGSDGVAVGLGAYSIPPGKSGTVHIYVGTIHDVLYKDSQDANYASAVFSPAYFIKSIIYGNTDLTVTFHLPPGVKPDEPRWHSAPSGFPAQPQTGLDENGRIYYRWENPNANGWTVYTFGASFPKSYVPASAIVSPNPFAFLSRINFENLLPFACIGFFALIIITSVVQSGRRRLQYLPPKISIEGHGIKRGLTAIEAAILLEQPLDKVLTMVLFSVVKKGAAAVTKRDPLELSITSPQPEGLNQYEIDFLNAFKETGATRRRKMQDMVIGLVKGVSGKMKGFSRKETIDYYRDITRRAWAQVEAANTPEVKSEKYNEVMEWTMLDKDYGDRTQEVFRNQPVFVPMWWGRYDPGFGGSGAPKVSGSPVSAPGGAGGALPHLPGSDFAASIVTGVQGFSSKVVGNISDFTSRVTQQTNPVPQSTSGHSGSSRGGSSGGSSCVCACACACAGCACACAGGGR